MIFLFSWFSFSHRLPTEIEWISQWKANVYIKPPLIHVWWFHSDLNGFFILLSRVIWKQRRRSLQLHVNHALHISQYHSVSRTFLNIRKLLLSRPRNWLAQSFPEKHLQTRQHTNFTFCWLDFLKGREKWGFLRRAWVVRCENRFSFLLDSHLATLKLSTIWQLQLQEFSLATCHMNYCCFLVPRLYCV